MFCIIYTYVMYKAGWFLVQLEQFHHIILLYRALYTYNI